MLTHTEVITPDPGVFQIQAIPGSGATENVTAVDEQPECANACESAETTSAPAPADPKTGAARAVARPAYKPHERSGEGVLHCGYRGRVDSGQRLRRIGGPNAHSWPGCPWPPAARSTTLESMVSPHLEAIRAALAALVNDPDISDRQRLRALQTVDGEITGHLLDLRTRLPEPQSRRGDPPRI